MREKKEMLHVDFEFRSRFWKISHDVRVLAALLKHAVAEYSEYSIEEIVEFINPESIRDFTEVSPDRTNLQWREIRSLAPLQRN